MKAVNLIPQNSVELHSDERTGTMDFEFLLPQDFPLDEIDYISAGCSCTDAYYDPESHSIKGGLNLDKAGVTPQHNSTTKTVSVLFDPQIPEWYGDENKRRVRSTAKRQQSLRITVRFPQVETTN